MPTPPNHGAILWELPPLILHPFNEQAPPSALLENSKAALMLCGLMPRDGSATEDLHRRLLVGRYSETRMLFFLGKDVFRWIEQCMECIQRVPELQDTELAPQSFVRLLTETPPPGVRDKLLRWGVADYYSIFSRAIGLNILFVQPPAFDTLSEKFLSTYHRYADALYRSYLEAEPHCPARADAFHFELYASGEYSRKLELEWQGEEEN
jgi:hypothetical protein